MSVENTPRRRRQPRWPSRFPAVLVADARERVADTGVRSFWRALGPGVIVGAADDDPSGIATYSVAGAQLGSAMLWTALLTWPLLTAVQRPWLVWKTNLPLKEPSGVGVVAPSQGRRSSAYRASRASVVQLLARG